MGCKFQRFPLTPSLPVPRRQCRYWGRAEPRSAGQRAPKGSKVNLYCAFNTCSQKGLHRGCSLVPQTIHVVSAFLLKSWLLAQYSESKHFCSERLSRLLKMENIQCFSASRSIFPTHRCKFSICIYYFNELEWREKMGGNIKLIFPFNNF